ATTVACARCHDHKIDAVSTKDYYALLGVLRSSRLVSHTIDAPEVNAAPRQQLREIKARIRKELGETWQADARTVGRYLLAAEARRAKLPQGADLTRGLDPKRLERWVEVLSSQTAPANDPLRPWRVLAIAKSGDAAAFTAEWK